MESCGDTVQGNGGPWSEKACGKAIKPTGCDGISVSGSAIQSSINGCFEDRNTLVNGFPSYVNGNGNYLWWKNFSNGAWYIGSSDNVGSTTARTHGFGQGGDGPAAASSWKTYDYSGSQEWVAEALTVTDSRGLCSNPPACLPSRIGLQFLIRRILDKSAGCICFFRSPFKLAFLILHLIRRTRPLTPLRLVVFLYFCALAAP